MMDETGTRTMREALHPDGGHPSDVVVARVGAFGRHGGTAVMALGCLALLGWALDVAALKSLVPGQIAMVVNTALMMILAGAGLRLLGARRVSRNMQGLGRVCAASVVVIASAMLSQYITGRDLGIDQLIFDQTSELRTSAPGRSAPNTLVCFVLLGLALLLWDVRVRRVWPSHVLALLVFGATLLALFGYATGVTSLYGLGGYSMAVNTATGFVILSLGVFALRPGRGAVELVTSVRAGGILVRRFLPVVFVFPAVLGAVRLAGEEADLYSTNVGVWIMVLGTTGLFAVLTWVLARRIDRIDAARERSGSHFRGVVESVADGILALDCEGRIILANPAASTITGFSSEEMLGERQHTLLHHTRADGTPYPGEECPLMEALAEGAAHYGEEVLWRRDGGGFPAECTLTPTEEDGRTTGAVVLFRDISERKEAERELATARDAALESSRLKSEFLANMSHEIRTPMNGVIGMTELLLDGPLEAEQRSFAETIRSSGGELMRIIEDILDFSKIEAGKLDFERTELEVHGTVSDVCELLGPRAAEKELELSCSVEAETPERVLGDPGRLRQILTNLIGNAVKFTEQGHITVRVGLSGESSRGDPVLRFEVTDTGIGIDPSGLHRLFESFSQADGSTTRAYGGTGLGLTISKQLVELMGGEIGARSEPGLGSTFWFTGRFEAYEPTEEPSPTGAGSGRISSTEMLPTAEEARPVILVAEDNPVNAAVTVGMLRRRGYRTELVPDGREALAAFSRSRFDAVLMDCQMPELDGYAASLEIRLKEGSGARTPIIAATANAMKGDREKCLAAGMDDYLTKPIRIEALDEVLDRWVPQVSSEETRPASKGLHPMAPRGGG
jgi:PAS domain S-box-containing protein